RLPHSAFAARHRDGAAEVRHVDGRGRWWHGAGSGARGAGRLGAAGVHDVDAYGADAVYGLGGLAGVAGQRGGVVPGQLKGEADGAGVVHDEVADHPGGHDVLGETGVLEGAKRGFDAVPEDLGGRSGHGAECTGTPGRGATTATTGR